MQSNQMEFVEPGAFNGIRRLEVLSLQNNTINMKYELTSAALRLTTSLKKLDLSRNMLTMDMVPELLQNLTTLENLFLDTNIIMRLDQTVFEGLVYLKELSLRWNYIYEIECGTFEGLVKLKKLDLAYNLLPCIDDYRLTQIQMLNLSFNNLEWFQSQETDTEFHLEMLDISNNQLLFFPLLPRQHHLHTLLLSNNRMRFYGDIFGTNSSTADYLIVEDNITSVTTVDLWSDDIHSNLSALHYLDMSHNQFAYFPHGFFSNMSSLSYLKLNWNCLQAFHVSPSDITSLVDELDLSNNELVELQAENISPGILSLSYFNLSNNNLCNLPRNIFSSMTRIHTIDLSNNPLHLCSQSELRMGEGKCIDIRNVPSLRRLYLSGCGMELNLHRVFYGNTLTHLDLSYNSIKGITFLDDTARMLQSLFLRGCLAFNITVDFSAFMSLTVLDISENALTTFPASLNGLALHYLDLRNNKLISLPLYNTRLLGSLKTLYISENPFECCELGWKNVLISSISIPDLQKVTCNFSNRYLPVRDLPASINHSCQWKNGGPWLYLLLTLPVCLTLLVALLLLFLTFKQTLLQTVKRRCRRSTSY
nr:LOC100158336 protein [Xenopus laevis]